MHEKNKPRVVASTILWGRFFSSVIVKSLSRHHAGCWIIANKLVTAIDGKLVCANNLLQPTPPQVVKE